MVLCDVPKVCILHWEPRIGKVTRQGSYTILMKIYHDRQPVSPPAVLRR